MPTILELFRRECRRRGYVERYDRDGTARGITIGSDKSKPPGQRGGTPVKVGGDGRIESGPSALRGRRLTDLDSDRREQEAAADVGSFFESQAPRARPPSTSPARPAAPATQRPSPPRSAPPAPRGATQQRQGPRARVTRVHEAIADDYGIDAGDLADLHAEVWQTERQRWHESETALRQIRNGPWGRRIDARRLRQWEERGGDSSTYPGFDVLADGAARAHPELGLSTFDASGSPQPLPDASERLWEMLKAGRRREPTRDDPALVRQAADMLTRLQGEPRMTASELEEAFGVFRRAGLVERYGRHLQALRLRLLVRQAAAEV
jgi:hypothetical protein